MQSDNNNFTWYSGASSQVQPQSQFVQPQSQFVQPQSQFVQPQSQLPSYDSQFSQPQSDYVPQMNYDGPNQGYGYGPQSNNGQQSNYDDCSNRDSQFSGYTSSSTGPSTAPPSGDSAHPPSNTEQSTSSSSSDRPSSDVTPKNLPQGDGIHDGPLSDGLRSDQVDSVQNSHMATTSSSATLNPSGSVAAADKGLPSTTTPAPLSNAAAPAVHPTSEPHTADPSMVDPSKQHHGLFHHDKQANKEKKPHKSLKEKVHDWKAHRHGGAKTNAFATVHPKDSRDGRTLPSQEELSSRVIPVEGEHPTTGAAPTLKKDAGDATGKSITGTDANPSKKSMPFKVPEPGLGHNAPIEAKS